MGWTSWTPGRNSGATSSRTDPSPAPSWNYDSSVAFDLIHTYIWTCIHGTETNGAYKEKIQINTNSFLNNDT
jgi:hypothetical protein